MPQAARELAISLPFKIDANGKVGATVDQAKIWQDRVRTVVGTSLNSRVYRPSFGCKIANSIFDNDYNIESDIEEAISSAFQNHLSLLSLTDVQVNIEQSSRVIIVSIEYDVPQQGSFIAEFGVATIDGTNPLSEEVSWQST